LIKIACGINNITLKESHVGGTEISLRDVDEQEILTDPLKIKEKVKAIHPTSLVSFATIPAVHFAKAQEFYINQGYLKIPKHNPDELAVFQERLSVTLDKINTRLIQENRILQYIPLWGVCQCSQAYWHQEVEKIGKRKRAGTVIKIKRVPWNALTDGIHPNDQIACGWFIRLHQDFKRDIIRIKSSPPLPP
jgi:hypothetical protein